VTFTVTCSTPTSRVRAVRQAIGHLPAGLAGAALLSLALLGGAQAKGPAPAAPAPANASAKAPANASAPAPAPQMNLPRTHLTSGMYRIEVQLAVTDTARQVGLMHRTNMPDNEGMLFVFEQPNTQCFWMRNTLIALTAAFLDDNGTVVNLADMKPQTEDNHCSAKPVRYVLEMNKGWFDKRRIQAGSVIKGLP
jgi:hypothetical protein